MSDKKRFAVVGTGGRVPMFIDPLARDYTADADLVGLCDPSETRREYHRARLMRDYGYHDVPTFSAADFDKMIAQTRPDTVIVCTKDATHHEYIVRALRLGCDVVTEKPMTTDGEKCREILQAVKETGKNVRVTFNVRWGNGVSKVRQLIEEGVIGRITHVNQQYLLDTTHGADYFRRWHSEKASSGGLLIHKSTHHFDLVNWWIDAIPEQVFAYGSLQFYGEKNALARGDKAFTGYDRYTGTPEAKNDPFALSLDKDDASRGLYLNAEKETGYIRDRNVFRPGIDIEDTMSVLVRYRTGAVMTYSLVAYSPYEGYRISLTGDRGRIEYEQLHGAHIIKGQSDEELAKEQAHMTTSGGMTLKVMPHFGESYEVPIIVGAGSHGGGDPLLQRQIFSKSAPQDNLGRNAGPEQGAASMLIGAAANKSMNTGEPVLINDLCPLKPQAVHLSQLD